MLRTAVASSALLLATSLVAGCSGSDSKDDSSPAPTYPGVEEPAATRCNGTIGAVEIDGDVVVPDKKTCHLEGTAVAGRVTVSPDATLVARDARFGEGISAHRFKRVDLLGGTAEGRPKDWYYGNDKTVDMVFDGGGDVTVRFGPYDGQYYFIDNTGQVEIVGLSLDLGHIYCKGNAHPPKVRGISAESPGVLQGQCAGLENFGMTDF